MTAASGARAWIAFLAWALISVGCASNPRSDSERSFSSLRLLIADIEITYHIGPHGTDRTDLEISPDDLFDLQPSPDGNQVAMWSGRSLKVAETTDMRFVPIVAADPGEGSITSVMWMPRGDQIAYVTDRGLGDEFPETFESQVRVIRLGEDQPRLAWKVQREELSLMLGSISSQGEAYLFETGHSDLGDLWKLNLETSGAERIASGNDFDEVDFQFSPNHEELYVRRDVQIFTHDLATNTQRLLTQGQTIVMVPDGSALFFERDNDASKTVSAFRLNLPDETESLFLGWKDRSARVLSISPDGRYVWVNTSDAQEREENLVVDVATSEVTARFPQTAHLRAWVNVPAAQA